MLNYNQMREVSTINELLIGMKKINSTFSFGLTWRSVSCLSKHATHKSYHNVDALICQFAIYVNLSLDVIQTTFSFFLLRSMMW